MEQWTRARYAVEEHFQDLSTRVVAKSGIATDRFHLGKLILQALKDTPDLILQIDGYTGESETYGSALKRSVQCATALKKLGIKKGDVITLMAPNHIHLCIPMYAAFYIGAITAGIDLKLKLAELKNNFEINKPSMVFCQSERASDVNLAIQELNLECKIVTFDKSDEYLTLTDLLSTYGEDISIEDFKASDFDPTETLAILQTTSGTTGLPKSAAVTHSNFTIAGKYNWVLFNKFPAPTRLSCFFSLIDWYSALFQLVYSPIVGNSRLQSSLSMTAEHACYLINKYKPSFTMAPPCFWTTVFKEADREKCDFSCFELIYASGSAITSTLRDAINKFCPNACLVSAYGSSELSGLAFAYDSSHPMSVGRPLPVHEMRVLLNEVEDFCTWTEGQTVKTLNTCRAYCSMGNKYPKDHIFKLVSPETQKDVTEPNVTGELWIKSPVVFKGYYNNPETTESTFSTDGWLKTGDLFKRDEQWYFYYVDRMKMCMKYRNNQVSPVELENVIAKHPAVSEVAVAGVPHPEDGYLPVACIVLNKNATVTAQEIKDLVKESLIDYKQLRGGVIFLEKLPMTSSWKVNRKALATLVLSSERL